MIRFAILKSIVGPDVFEALNKALVKLNTKSVVDLAELHSAMKTVPKSIMAFLMRELKDMKKDETRQMKMPWAENSEMTITKMDSDVYKGKIVRDSKVVHDFDLTAIPQLAAHIMSTFEVYDEDQAGGGGGEKTQEQKDSSDDMRSQIKALDEKINALMMLVASQQASKYTEDFSKRVSERIEKSEINKFEKFCKSYRGLKKAGLAPTMPKPPRPGTKVGGNQGITQAGFHGDKTEHSDSNAKPIIQLKNPNLKAPKPAVGQAKQPKQAKTIGATTKSEKTLTFAKSELTGSCEDCGMVVSDCACFKALSRPEIKKSDAQNVTLKFSSDWDSESIETLYKSIKRRRE